MGGILKTFDLVPADAVMILIGAVFFLILWKALENSLFGPYLQLIEKREAATSGAAQTAQEKLVKTDDLNRQYESKLLEQRIIFMQAKLAALDRAKNESDQIIGNATKAAQDKLSAGRKEIAAKTLENKAAAEREANSLTEMIVSKLTSPAGLSSEPRR
jgi:F0F1-type ATP synthase membrane subunit b/b'